MNDDQLAPAHHVTRVLLILALLAAWSLRVYDLVGPSLWYDEAVSAHVAAQGVAELTRWTADDIQPPLYYYILAGWTRAIGRSEWALRFPSVALGLLTVALLWVVGARLLGRAAGVAAAWLAALHPLYVYYSQEARMYTMLVFLGALAGYLLLRAVVADSPRRAWGWWAGFALAATAALYTHYFAAFLLFAYGLCFGIYWLAHGHVWRRLWPALAAVLAVILLYLPWLPAVLNRYQVDRSYWSGALKLGEAVRHAAVSFTAAAPETMLERDAVRLLPLFTLAFAVSALVMFWDRKTRPTLGYLLIVLFVPVVAALIVASRTPKFNARYLMLASPAYLLILAGGIGALSARPAGAGRTAGRVLAAVLAGFLAAASLIGVRNWFTDPAFTKAQWREAAAAVRVARAPDEPVLLVSGHAWPAWDYYAPDIPAVHLPDLDVLDVNATLGFETGTALEEALAGKPGAWLVQWQEEVVDPAGFTPYFLDRAGAEQPRPGEFWQLAVRHWALRPDAVFPSAPQPDHDDGANYAHKIALIGWDDLRNGTITLYWRALNPIDRDLTVSLVWEDASGREIARWDGRPAGYNYPTLRWRPGEALFGAYPLPPEIGPGEVYLTVALYDADEPSGLDIMDVADNPAGKRVRLGPIYVDQSASDND